MGEEGVVAGIIDREGHAVCFLVSTLTHPFPVGDNVCIFVVCAAADGLAVSAHRRRMSNREEEIDFCSPFWKNNTLYA